MVTYIMTSAKEWLSNLVTIRLQKMLVLIVLVVLSGHVMADSIPSRCECAMFNSLQIERSNTPVPLEYYGSFIITPDQCDRPLGVINDCMLQCQQQFDTAGGLNGNLCNRTEGTTPRCTGSQWCESLHNSGITNIAAGEGSNSLYYRMIDCEGTEQANWQYAFRDFSDDGLCCEEGIFSHCSTPCGEACAEQNLCECGAFIAGQFDPKLLNGTNPLPLQDVGAQFGPGGDFACAQWPGPEFGHPCDTACLFASRLYKGQVSLSDPSPLLPSVSVGDFYCQILKNRWSDQWPEDGIGPQAIDTFGRMPGCDPKDGTNDFLKWNTARRYGCHHQVLCCDGDGFRYQCEGTGL